jgi:hypothetical protein
MGRMAGRETDRNSLGRPEETHQNPQSGQSISWLRFKQNTNIFH